MSSPEEEVPENDLEEAADAADESAEGEEALEAADAEEADSAESASGDAGAEEEPEQLEEGGVIVYDFAHPSHKLNSRLPVLDVINEKIATAMSKELSAQFHQNIEVKTVTPAFEKFETYVSSMAELVSINQFRMDPLSGSCMLLLGGDLIFMMVDSFFGGVEAITELPGQRKFTPTELRITQRIREKILSAMKDAWAPVLGIDPQFEKSLTQSEFASPAHPASVVVRSRYEVELKAGKGQIDIVIPYSVLEPVRAKLTNDLGSMSEQNRQWQREFSRQVMECETDIEGVFAESRITVRQLMNLKVGDFIPLGQVQSVEFSSEGIPLFEAAVGVSNGMVSASVRKWHDRKRAGQ